MRDLVILGAGGHGRELLDIVEAINAVHTTWRFRGFLDDGDPPADRLRRRSAQVLGPVAALADLDAAYLIGIGQPDHRERVAALAAVTGHDAATLVHPLASLGTDNHLSPGVVLAAGARVTTNVHLGRHVHLNVGAMISHDGIVRDFVTLSPGVLINGGVTLQAGVLLGTAAVVTPGCAIGAGTWIGAGAVVVQDLPPGVVATGVPARTRRRR